MSAILASAKVELRTAWRSGLVLPLLLLTLALVVAALVTTAVRQAETARIQQASEQLDAATFLSQKMRNPHTVAHFSRYAVRPADALGVLDSGASAYQGTAIWLEAHKQDPANFRPAEDRAAAPVGLELSPAWVFATILPLIAMLLGHGAFAASRERRTIDLELMTAGGARSLALGKLVAQTSMALLPAVLLALAIAAFAASRSAFPDAAARAAVWVGIVAVYGAIFVMAGLAISAVNRTVRGALTTILAIWVMAVAIVPRVASSAAAAIAPVPMGQAFTADMRADVQKEVEADREATGITLSEGPKTIVVGGEVLNTRGVALNRGEAAANRVHDAARQRLSAAEDRQEGIRLALGAFSPTTAFRTLSAAFAARELAHQRDFTAQAEASRRRIVTFLNDDQARHAGELGSDYLRNPEFWRTVPRFEYRAPMLKELSGWYSVTMGILLLWVLIAAAALWIGVRQMERSR